MKTFRFVWPGGKEQVIEGHDITDACQRAGIGFESIMARSYYEELTVPQPSGDIRVHVVKATVVQIGGLDECTLTTDLIGTMWPAGTPVSFRFSLQLDTGAKWILDRFGIEAEVITVPSGYGSSKP